MNDVVLETVVKKIEAQDEKIGEQEKQVWQVREMLVNQVEYMKEIMKGMGELGKKVERLSFPEEEVRKLSKNMEVSAGLLRQPVRSEVRHHHHVTKAIWVIFVLGLGMMVMVAGWYSTGEKLELYRENDTKYRWLKLEGNKGLREVLRETDSLYWNMPKMREVVVKKEEDIQERLKMMRKAEELEREVQFLRNKANKKHP